jgi:hypothetical protein
VLGLERDDPATAPLALTPSPAVLPADKLLDGDADQRSDEQERHQQNGFVDQRN